MGKWIAALGFVGVCGAAGWLHAQVDPASCITIEGRARYGAMGYDHIVEVNNQCSMSLTCQVWTDVDPEPKHTLQVEPGDRGSVATRRGSPSRKFQAQGECKR